MRGTQTRFVLIGRDGVVNRRLSCGFVRSWAQFEFLPRAMEALRLLASHRYQTIVVSREEGVASGEMTASELQALTSRFLLEVALGGGHIHQVYSCVHRREEHCECRPPNVGLLKEAIAEHAIDRGQAHVICDTPAELEAATALALPSTLVRRNNLLPNDLADLEDEGVAGCFYVAVQQLLRRDAVSWNEAVTQGWPGAAVPLLV
jgi:D-glycero-D-manno-heptose 1,7-bisphosphate phosphatase